MNINKFKAELIIPPINIVSIFFPISSFIFHPVKMPEERGKLSDIKISFESNIVAIDEENKKVQIQVMIQNSPQEESKLEFTVVCIGIYTWSDDVFDETSVKNIYQWGTSIQVSAIREHIVKETSRGPYSIPNYVPMGLIRVISSDSSDNFTHNAKSRKTIRATGKNRRHRPEA